MIRKKSIREYIEGKISKLLTLVLSLLGFAGCEGIGDEPVLYGCPYANYKAKGRVLNEAQEPVEGLDVVVRKVERYRLADGVEKE
ncbi:MAG: radical SAM-associated putative lipoprotein, partial [Bacteroidaceae bacterium]|nr:radical SAM-associated putative lipoprotein [Bacteroidaceae bacterium]